jgi:acetyl esterase
MAIEENVGMLLDSVNGTGEPGLGEQSLSDARDGFRLLAALDGPGEPVDVLEDRAIPGPAGDVPVRVYRSGDDTSPRPVLLWFHGGGFTIGDLETADPTARKLANRTDAVVVSVDYRLAPEHPHPAALDDARAALTWVADHGREIHGDPTRIAVGGDSAGGTLAALLGLESRDGSRPALHHQMLLYPWLDLTGSYPSMEENAEGYLLTKAGLEWFAQQYLGTAGDRKAADVSPLWADDVSAVAPATVYTAEFDPLRDEGAAYAQRLTEAGVPVEYRCFDGMVHEFCLLGMVTPVAAEGIDAIATALRDAFAS